ncbi:hypothetical protein GUJ93_ZPchr0002g26796 [Zizania palustris]|uniref:Reverse transcriptase domain-containing protein n=1 Tax=Zizania palustris TaxID=103762 RepID=A0A8J5RZX3_ZIZPA|nr:hypothetical protein GUJ93_ZPchr0002g26796 [Zizania palustris]
MLEAKGYPHRWNDWIMRVVMGGKVCIRMNDKVGPYFNTCRGLRQGDPLSPLLFDIAADALSFMVSKAVQGGLIAGLGGDNITGGVPILQYADDTIFLLQNDLVHAKNLKFILCLFEHMSGLKVNFHKSEVFCVGMNLERSRNFCQVLTCKMGDFPIQYLGLPLNKNRITNCDWRICENKVEKRLSCWKGKLLDIGSRLILLNSCISSIPLYMLSFYEIPKGVLKRIDACRSRLLWQEGQGARKYHLENWAMICSPKDYGGLGVLDLKWMNIALMGKWLWKFETESGIWQTLLSNKYSRHKKPLCLMESKMGDSQFWKTLMRIKPLYRKFCRMKIGNGENISFWEDTWVGNKPLSEMYHDLFITCFIKHMTVAEVFKSNWNVLKFRRDLVGSRFQSWIKMKRECSSIVLSDTKDSVLWSLTSKGTFTVSSFYLALKTQNLVKRRNVVWGLKVPLKIKIFLWLAYKNKILTRDNLVKRGWKGDIKNCVFCCREESVQHLFFDCSVAKFIWRMVYTCFNIGPFADMKHVWDTWFGKLNKRVRNVVGVGLAAVFWSVWRSRNDACFQNKLINDPLIFVKLICFWLSFWSKLQKSEAREKDLDLGVRLLEHLASDIYSRRRGWNMVDKMLNWSSS